MCSSTDRHFPREGSQATPRAAEIRRHSRAVTMPGSGSGVTATAEQSRGECHRYHCGQPSLGTKEADRTPVVMAAGSCVFFLGTLWHGGGSNQSDSALTAQYCEPWLRPQEAFTLSMTRDTGYSAHARIQHPSALHRAGRRHAPQAAAGAGATSDLVLIHVVERDRTQLSFTDDVEQLVIDRRDGRVVEVSDDNCLWVEVLAGHVHDVLRGNYVGVR